MARNLWEISVRRLMGKDVKVGALSDGRMQVTHLDDGRYDSGVAQYLEDGIAVLFRVPNGILPILVKKEKGRGKRERESEEEIEMDYIHVCMSVCADKGTDKDGRRGRIPSSYPDSLV